MGVEIRTADRTDRERVVRVLDAAFWDDPVSGWIFPSADHRRTTQPRLMAAFTDTVLEEGWIDVTVDGSACALWLSVGAHDADDPGEDEGPDRLKEAVDPANERVELIARLTGAIHPRDRAHDYLWLIAVAPEHQGEGLGTALLRTVLGRCDREGRPAYLEASNARSRGLYESLGFVARTPLDLPEGPRMWPMWREPHG